MQVDELAFGQKEGMDNYRSPLGAVIVIIRDNKDYIRVLSYS